MPRQPNRPAQASIYLSKTRSAINGVSFLILGLALFSLIYFPMRTLSWVRKKLHKLKDKPESHRRTYENKIKEKARANFDPRYR